jgi:hypothetical protein
MGMTRFMTTISLKGSGTYLFGSLCRWPLDAIPGSGARNTAVHRRAWVRLVVAIAAGVPLQHNPYFSKCRISRMIGVMQQIVEHSGYLNV